MTLDEFKNLAIRVKRNSLDHRNPEAFYIEREEIADAMFGLHREAQLQGVNSLTDLLFVPGEIEHGVTLDEIKHDR